MRELNQVSNIDGPSAAYPAGRIRNDNQPTVDGTPVVEELYGDIVQFFHALMRTAGITYNNLPENQTTGYQLFNALTYYIRNVPGSTTEKGVWESATTDETRAGLSENLVVTAKGLEAKRASTTGAGIVKKPSATETKNGVESDSSGRPYYVSPSLLVNDVLGGLIQTVVEIGTWNMVSTQYVDVAHGLTLSKIRSVEVMIVNDSGTLKLNLNSMNVTGLSYNGGIGQITSTNVRLWRYNSRDFDSTDFDSTSVNRGWIIINHLP